MSNRIITIGREFGSGGREFGKRLAEELGIAYYDREIMEEISKRTQLAESYIHHIVEGAPGIYYPITIGKTMHGAEPDYLLRQYTSVYAEQTNTIRDMAEKSDCVIVGRCADYILRDKHPLRLFIYAGMPSKLKRCREKSHEDDALNDRRACPKDPPRGPQSGARLRILYRQQMGRTHQLRPDDQHLQRIHQGVRPFARRPARRIGGGNGGEVIR